MTIKLYNIITQKLEPLEFQEIIKIYCCGPTIYDDIHIGNGRPLVIFNALTSFLKKYYPNKTIKYVRNITDIDEKIINKVLNNNSSYDNFIQKELNNFNELMDYIDAYKPLQIRVTDVIEDIKQYITILIEKDYGYVTNEGNVYFNVKKFPHYKCICRHTDDKPSITTENEKDKHHWEDFALWKRIYNYDEINTDGIHQTQDKIFWSSPWGNGIPGWHIECSTIINKYLGDVIDIHGGGQDLMFPHHDNELAQNWGLYEKIFCHHWLHNGMVLIDGKKMAKSTGNFIHLKNIVKDEYSGNVFKYLILSTHYRQPLNFSENKWKDASNNFSKIFKFIHNHKESFWNKDDYQKFINEDNQWLLDPITHDFNTVIGLNEIHKWIKNFKNIYQLKQMDLAKNYYFYGIFIGESLGFNFSLD